MTQQLQGYCRSAIFNQTLYPVEHALDPLRPVAHFAIFDKTAGAGGLGNGPLELRKQRRVVGKGRNRCKLQFLQQRRISLGNAEDHLDKPLDALGAEMLADIGEATGGLLQHPRPEVICGQCRCHQMLAKSRIGIGSAGALPREFLP